MASNRISMFNPKSKSSIIGMTIIALLMAIATVIFRQQFHYNPAVTALSATLFSSGSPLSARSGLSSQLSSQNGNEAVSTGNSVSGGLEPIVRPVKPIEPMSPLESFNELTLSDKIDGKAELYIPSGFKSLICQRFKAGKASDLWIELFIYDMGLADNAFSVFSRQRREGATPLSIGTYGYQTENALFIVHGHFYLEIIASSPSADALKWMADLSRAFIEDHPDLAPKRQMALPDLFPSEESDIKEAEPRQDQITLDRESITLITSDVFGFDQLDQVYTAAYLVNGASMVAFISKRDSSEAAQKLAAEYAAFLKSFGGKLIDSGDKNVHGIEIMDTIELIFSQGQYLAGVREAESMAAAKILVSKIEKSISAHENSTKPDKRSSGAE